MYGGKRRRNVSLCIPVAGVTLRSSRLRAGLKTKLAACRSGYSFRRSFRVRPRAAPRRGGAARRDATGEGDADRERGGAGERPLCARAPTAGAAVRGRAGFARVCRDVPRRLTESYITVGTHPVPDRASQPEPPSTQRAPFGFPIALRSASRSPVCGYPGRAWFSPLSYGYCPRAPAEWTGVVPSHSSLTYSCHAVTDSCCGTENVRGPSPRYACIGPSVAQPTGDDARETTHARARERESRSG